MACKSAKLCYTVIQSPCLWKIREGNRHMKRVFLPALVAGLLSLCACAQETRQPDAPPQPAETVPAAAAETAEPERPASAAPLQSAEPEPSGEDGGLQVKTLALDTPFLFLPQDGGEAVECRLVERVANEWEYRICLLTAAGEFPLLENYSAFEDARIVSFPEGGSVLILTADEASDDYFTRCYMLIDAAPECRAELFGLAGDVEADGTVPVSRAVNLLGTWGAARRHMLSADGTLLPAPDSMWEMFSERAVVTAAALPAELLTDGAWQAVTLEPGTALYPTATDDEGLLLFSLENGQSGRLTFTREDYSIRIGGVPEEELFEELFYAG